MVFCVHNWMVLAIIDIGLDWFRSATNIMLTTYGCPRKHWRIHPGLLGIISRVLFWEREKGVMAGWLRSWYSRYDHIHSAVPFPNPPFSTLRLLAPRVICSPIGFMFRLVSRPLGVFVTFILLWPSWRETGNLYGYLWVIIIIAHLKRLWLALTALCWLRTVCDPNPFLTSWCWSRCRWLTESWEWCSRLQRPKKKRCKICKISDWQSSRTG